MRFLLSAVMPGNPNSETNLQDAEAHGHKGVAPGRRGKERRSAETHQAKTHDRNDAHGKGAAGDDSSSIEKEPDARKHANSSRCEKRTRQQAANDDRRRKAEQKLASGTGKKSGICAMRLGGCRGRGDGYSDKGFH